MRDYAELPNILRKCSQTGTCALCEHVNVCLEKGCAIERAAGAIEELLAAVPHWISVEERLPDDQCDDARAARGGDYIHKVLAASVTPNYTVMDTAYLENGIWSLSQYTSWKQIIGAPVTHWMPLPAPPKGGVA